MKTGFKTTEFVLAFAGNVAGVLMAAMHTNPWVQLGGLVLAAISGGSYSAARAKVKQAEADACAHVEHGTRLAEAVQGAGYALSGLHIGSVDLDSKGPDLKSVPPDIGVPSDAKRYEPVKPPEPIKK